MTSELPASGGMHTAGAASPPRVLRRRAGDRVIAGVAAGLADYLNIDPLLARAAFVGLMIFGGAGIVLYVGAWLLIPVEGKTQCLAESALASIGLTPRRLLAAAIVLGALVVVIQALNDGYGGFYPGFVDARLFFVLMILVLGFMLLRRNGVSSAGAVAGSGVSVTGEATAPRPMKDVVKPRPQTPSSPLGWYVVAAALIAVGLLALVSNAAHGRVLPGQFFGVALAIVGIGLIIGSWWGRARRLILAALLVLPLAWGAAFINVPLEGGVGDQHFAPVSASELRDAYRLMGGRLTLDLRNLLSASPVRIAASVAVGEVVVMVPPDARLEIDSHVGAGGTWILNEGQSGTAVVGRYVRGSGSRQFVLDLGAGIGGITVETPPKD